MFDFSAANNQPCDTSNLFEEFEFVMPKSTASAHESFRKAEEHSLSPADELFYKGQLLPLLLPCRQKMVQELYTSETSPSIVTSEKENADPHADNAPHTEIPCSFANSHREPPSKITRSSTKCGKDLPSSMAADSLEDLMHQAEKDQPSMNGAISKPRLRWKVLFRKGGKSSLVEAACCHFTRSTSGPRNEASKVNYAAIESCVSAFHRSDSCSRGVILSPKRPRRTLSSLSSSACLQRTPSVNSQSLHRCDKGFDFGLKLTAKSPKESLVLKARDYLQRSFKLLKLAKFKDQKSHRNRADLLKEHHDYQSLHMGSAFVRVQWEQEELDIHYGS